MKKVIKASSQSDLDNGAVSGMPAAYHSQQYQQKAPAASKTKGLVNLAVVRFLNVSGNIRKSSQSLWNSLENRQKSSEVFGKSSEISGKSSKIFGRL